MSHVAVMSGEVVHYLLYNGSRVVLDGTVGCGGHSRAILAADPAVRLVGVDTDAEALSEAARELEPFGSRVRLIKASYTELPTISAVWGRLDGALLDLGLSSLQLDAPERGFSYSKDGPLDMRMSSDGLTAAAFIGGMSEMALADILRRFGEVTGASRIARAIKAASSDARLQTTGDLKRAVEAALGAKPSPALLSKVFQAVRIALNGELESIGDFLDTILAYVNPGARLVFIAYHSLEDSAVKSFLKRESSDCVCPPRTPVCVCGHRAALEILTRRIVKPSESEVAVNPRARSARLRAARVLGPGSAN
jgi:16S rRNA (cytosine1402-N4)-methyltransferase